MSDYFFPWSEKSAYFQRMHFRWSLYCFLLISALLLSCENRYQNFDRNKLFSLIPPSKSGIQFSNTLHQSDSFNILFFEFYYNGSGLAAGDIDNDGFIDLFFGSNMESSKLFLNKGDLKFEDITKGVGIDTRGKWVTGVNMIDVNADGWLDLYLCVGGNIADDYRNLLYISNGDSSNLHFTESAREVNLDDNGYSTQAAFLDYDLDGDLDIYLVTSAMNIPNKNRIRERKGDGKMTNTDRLYRNDGLNSNTRLPVYTNVSSSAGIRWSGFGLGASVSDINRDGWPDIYVANDYISKDLLYINQQDGTFEEAVDSFFSHLSYSAMGADMGDINNDGLIDLVAVDMLPPDQFRKRIMAGSGRTYGRYQMEKEAGYSEQYIRNTLQLNNGNNTFSEIGQLAGIHQTDWSWTPLLADFDNDGYKDLFIGNGIPHDITNMDFVSYQASKFKNNNTLFTEQYQDLLRELDTKGNVKIPNFLFRNIDGIQFADSSAAWGLTEPSQSNSAVYADLDNDGDLDLVINNTNQDAFLYQNNVNTAIELSHHYLQINLNGPEKNSKGIGAKIKITSAIGAQYIEHYPVRGLLSSNNSGIHFGLGADQEIDQLEIWWPDGKWQEINRISANQIITISYSDAEIPPVTEKPIDKKKKLFTNVTSEYGLYYQHAERNFNDFSIQPLIPHQYSREGPGIAVADINNDGLDDFYVGGSTSYSGQIFLQNASGNFTTQLLPGDHNYEDMGALFFDADGDGDEDLYVVSGGTGLPPKNRFYADRLYINEDGQFSHDLGALPDIRVCGSKVAACDFDRDGDLDLFIGARVDLERYPLPATSYLLRNDSDKQGVHFTNITSEMDNSLEKFGLISDVLWSDFDQDGWFDLILCGEWMPITIFKNNDGILKNITSETGLESYSGWWNSIAAADFDQDGDVDYVVGNLGLNSRFKTSMAKPMRVIAKDFDGNGKVDPIVTYYVDDKNYPIYDRDQLFSQLPYLRKNLPLYQDYARAQIQEIFDESDLSTAYVRESAYMASAYLKNDGKGHFEISALPMEAQMAPIFGIIPSDFNDDGLPDVLLSGNSYASDVETGRYDASFGLLLLGQGGGIFLPVTSAESGFFVKGDSKGTALLTSADGKSLVLTAINGGSLQAHEVSTEAKNQLRLNSDDATGTITFKNGKTERREFAYGNSYLSQSSRQFLIPKNVESITITSFRGIKREIPFTEN